MTSKEYAAHLADSTITPEQDKALRRLQERSDREWDDFLSDCQPPALPLAPYLSVWGPNIFIGIEPDGHTHS